MAFVGEMSGKKQLKEIVTPHKIGVLVFIKEFCNVKSLFRAPTPCPGPCPSSESQEEGADAQSLETWEYSRKMMRDFAITTLRLIQNPDCKLKQLNGIANKTFKPKLYELFKEKLQEIYGQGVAGIMDYISGLDMLIVDPKNSVAIVHKSSVIGLFVRRMLLAFDKMTFSQVTRLYRNYRVYYEDAFKADFERHSCVMDLSVSLRNNEAQQDMMAEEAIHRMEGIASHKQAELFIAQQAALIQTHEKEAMPPVELQQRIRELLKANPDLAEAHFLSYLNCLRLNEYCGAVYHLYNSFDRSTVGNSTDAKPTDEVGRSFRYAALNLVALHCRFDHKTEALSALREAITMAQDANDNVCLQHCLSWLYRLENENKEILLERFIAKTGDLSLSYLTSIGVQAFTQHKAITTAQPSHIFEYMMKSDILNCQHSMLELMSNSYAQKAALWRMYGKRCMSSLSSQLLLHLNTSDPARRGLYYSGEGVCLALSNVALLLADEGQMDSAELVLKQAKSRFPSHTNHGHIWMQTEQMLKCSRALRHGAWAAADAATQAMASLDEQESAIQLAQTLLYRGDASQASRIIFKLVDDIREDDVTAAEHQARVLLLQVELLCLTSNYASSIPPLTKCLAVCQQHYLDYLASIVVLHMANVQLLLGMPNQALSLLDRVMVSIMAHGSLFDRTRAHYLYARIVIARTKTTEMGSNERIDSLLMVMPMLSTIVEDFIKVEAFHRAKDALHLQACLYHELGHTEERNRCSLQYRQLDQDHGTAYPPRIELI